jgi:RNA polymerase sigma-70 factor (ECF subfamily)
VANESRVTDWVGAARAGDQTALAKLLALYHPQLAGRVAARLDADLRRRVSPEDLLQEVYVQVFQRVGQFKPQGPDSFLNWVITILDRKLIDARRGAHRARRDVRREVAPPAASASASYLGLLDRVYLDTGSPSQVVRRAEAVGALQECMASLQPSHRAVIELRFLAGRPVAEVAAELGRSEDAVIALTQRALKALRASMDGLGDFTRGA